MSSGTAHLEWYRRLADVFRDVLSDQSLQALLDRIADTMAELVPYDSLVLYESDDSLRTLTPVLARDEWAEQIMELVCSYGDGLTGWAVENQEAVLANNADQDPRVMSIPGTPNEPESLIAIPL